MFNNVTELWEYLVSTGPAGLLLGLVVFLIVYLGKYTGFVKNGNVARTVAAFSGLAVGGAAIGDVDANVKSIIAILAGGLVHELGEFIKDKKEKASE